MYQSITRSQIFVLDQDVALDFYVGTLGLELADDLDLGFMRWLTVRVPGEHGREILLEKPGPPAMDEATTEAVTDLLTKGAMGGWLCISTDDAQRTHDLLAERGVDITDAPSPRPYGVDFGIRDPFGNAIRIGEVYDNGPGQNDG